MNRGSHDQHHQDLHAHAGFNEAPIHESGKFCQCLTPVRMRTASMRPRFMNRGSASASIGIRADGIRRFNEAPIHESGKCVLLRIEQGIGSKASMRPRFMNRGSTSRTAPSRSVPAASMRPRFMNRGSTDLRGSVLRVSTASMRPRFMNRGSLSSTRTFDPTHSLQ